MSHRAPTLLALAFACFIVAPAAFAQTPAGPPVVDPAQAGPAAFPQVDQVTLASIVASTSVPAAGGLADTAPAAARPVRAPGSQAAGLRGGLIPLFASYAVLQALDVHSTLTAINRGGFERNPIVAPFVNHPAAFVACKAGVTTATFLAANRLAKRNRVAAYAMLAVADSAYAYIVAHNYQVASRLR